MFPLPYRIERILGGELQALATQVSTGLLQVIGLPAVAEGNTILIDEIRLGVAEACSGLGMLLIFVALGFAFAAVVDRPLLDRAILVASTVPIAVIANVCRITVTGLLHVWVGSRLADLVFHDLAGWLMMPFALGLLWAEMKFLTYVLVEEQVPEAIEIAFGVQPEKS
jgi:exosortase